MSYWQPVVNVMASWRGRFAYTNDSRRLWPLKYNAGDCSSVINAAFAQVEPGIHARLGGSESAPLGARSYNIAFNPRLTLVASGGNARGAALQALIGKLQPGDVICMGWNTGYYHSSGISHVELYAGGGKTWGHGGPGRGPTLTSLSYWLTNSRVYRVMRVPAKPQPKPKPATRPAKAASTSQIIYTVKAGDTLGKIAAAHGTTVAKLAADNGITDPNRIRVGQQIRIGGTATPTQPPAPVDPPLIGLAAHRARLTKKGHNKMKAVYYTKGRKYHVMVFDTISGFCHEYTTSAAGYNNRLAKGLETGSFTEITENHYNALRRDLANVRKGA